MNRRRFFGMLGGGLAAVGLGRWVPASTAYEFGEPINEKLSCGITPALMQEWGDSIIITDVSLLTIGAARAELIARQMREWKETVTYEVLRRDA